MGTPFSKFAFPQEIVPLEPSLTIKELEALDRKLGRARAVPPAAPFGGSAHYETASRTLQAIPLDV
jgi:hypothetical protein